MNMFSAELFEADKNTIKYMMELLRTIKAFIQQIVQINCLLYGGILTRRTYRMLLYLLGSLYCGIIRGKVSLHWRKRHFDEKLHRAVRRDGIICR